MVEQGRDIAVVENGKGVVVYRVSKGMEKIGAIRGKSNISAVGCSRDDRFVMVGTVEGSVWLCRTDGEEVEEELERHQEVVRASLGITSIFLTDDVAYIGSENGTIKVVTVERERRVRGREETFLMESGEGWMRSSIGAESAPGTESSVGAESVHGIGSGEGEGRYVFKVIREIKHNTPIEKVVAHGQSVYILDMRGRVKVTPQNVVYDHIGTMYFNKYLFCAENNTVFAEVGKTLTSMYFAKSGIKEVKISRGGGYFFILTEKELEIVEVESRKGRKVHAHRLQKEIEAVVVDSDRSLVYGVSGGKVELLEIGYVWIDQPMCDLEIRDTKVKKVVRDEEKEEESERGAQYFDVPMPKVVKDRVAPVHKAEERKSSRREGVCEGCSGCASCRERYFEDEKDEEGEGEFRKMFERAYTGGADSEEAKSSWKGESSTHRYEEDAKVPDDESRGVIENLDKLYTGVMNCAGNGKDGGVQKRAVKYPECAQNGVVGSIFCKDERNTLAFWAPECKVVLTEKSDHTEVEVTIREEAVRSSVIKEEEVRLAAASSRILVLYGGGVLRVYVTDTGVHVEQKRVSRTAVEGIERVACGARFICIVRKEEGEVETLVYSEDLEEVFSAVGKVVGISACEEYLAVIREEKGGVRVFLYKYAGREVAEIGDTFCDLERVEWCGVSRTGVVVLESSGRIYGVGRNRVTRISGSPLGVPLGVANEHIVYALKDAGGRPMVFPEGKKTLRIEKKPVLGGGRAGTDVYLSLELEISRKALEKTGMKEDREKAPGGLARGDERGLDLVQLRRRVRDEGEKIELEKRSEPANSTELSQTPVKKVKTINPFAR